MTLAFDWLLVPVRKFAAQATVFVCYLCSDDARYIYLRVQSVQSKSPTLLGSPPPNKTIPTCTPPARLVSPFDRPTSSGTCTWLGNLAHYLLLSPASTMQHDSASSWPRTKHVLWTCVPVPDTTGDSPSRSISVFPCGSTASQKPSRFACHASIIHCSRRHICTAGAGCVSHVSYRRHVAIRQFPRQRDHFRRNCGRLL